MPAAGIALPTRGLLPVLPLIPPANPTGSLRAVIHVVHRFFPLTLSQYLFPDRPIRADVSWGNCNATLSLLTRWAHIIDF